MEARANRVKGAHFFTHVAHLRRESAPAPLAGATGTVGGTLSGIWCFVLHLER